MWCYLLGRTIRHRRDRKQAYPDTPDMYLASTVCSYLPIRLTKSQVRIQCTWSNWLGNTVPANM
jgi:hypothetical protein